MSEHHDDDVLGKAYDARLMRRLLQHLRPYSGQVALALIAIFAGSLAELAQRTCSSSRSISTSVSASSQDSIASRPSIS